MIYFKQARRRRRRKAQLLARSKLQSILADPPRALLDLQLQLDDLQSALDRLSHSSPRPRRGHLILSPAIPSFISYASTLRYIRSFKSTRAALAKEFKDPSTSQWATSGYTNLILQLSYEAKEYEVAHSFSFSPPPPSISPTPLVSPPPPFLP